MRPAYNRRTQHSPLLQATRAACCARACHPNPNPNPNPNQVGFTLALISAVSPTFFVGLVPIGAVYYYLQREPQPQP